MQDSNRELFVWYNRKKDKAGRGGTKTDGPSQWYDRFFTHNIDLLKEMATYKTIASKVYKALRTEKYGKLADVKAHYQDIDRIIFGAQPEVKLHPWQNPPRPRFNQIYPRGAKLWGLTKPIGDARKFLMAFICQSWVHAMGRSDGKIPGGWTKVNLKDVWAADFKDDTGFEDHRWHSAQVRMVTSEQNCYWVRLLEDIGNDDFPRLITQDEWDDIAQEIYEEIFPIK